MLKFPILERILFKGVDKQQNSISCIVVDLLHTEINTLSLTEINEVSWPPRHFEYDFEDQSLFVI